MRLSSFLALPGQSATALARRCGVAPCTITRVANGTKKPSLALMEKIREHTLGAVRADDFLAPYHEPTPTAEAAATV